ncbi:branched-chain amino acid ABC transporter permease [Variovorax sp. LjRoot290]|uniref:branched-chain amino acid ABC transporter permease n=1 Tax=unclassified Variovorax TaxID=663243 RepID=UPI003ECC527F
MKSHTEATLALILFPLALGIGIFGSRLWLNFGAEVAIWALFAVSLNLLVGFGGMVSFGHAAYFGLGAYGAGLAAMRWGIGLVPATLIGMGLAALFALLFGMLCVRRSKVYFAMLTLAFSQLVWAVAFRWNDLTGGDQGINGLPMPQFENLLGWTNQRWFYWICLVLLCAVLYLLYRLARSPFGTLLNAAKLNPERVQFLGTSVPRVQLVAFVIAGALAGLAGALFAFHTRGLFPDYLFWTKGAEALNMVVLGGMNQLLGPVLGAAALLFINQEATAVTEYWSAVTGVMLGALILFAPGGLAGGLQRLFELTKRKGARKAGQSVTDLEADLRRPQ